VVCVIDIETAVGKSVAINGIMIAAIDHEDAKPVRGSCDTVFFNDVVHASIKPYTIESPCYRVIGDGVGETPA
jgi:hypothetical protein